MAARETTGRVVDLAALPTDFPTHRHEPAFWEALGRAVATYGFLEEILGKAIFALTATRGFPTPEAAEKAFERWLPTLERALSDALGGLIDSYGKALRDHGSATIIVDELLEDLRAAAVIRNALCHGSWRAPDEYRRSLPLYVTKKMQIFETPIDTAFLDQTRRHVVELACSVMDSVTHMGWQFPGSGGPGEPIWKR